MKAVLIKEREADQLGIGQLARLEVVRDGGQRRLDLPGGFSQRQR